MMRINCPDCGKPLVALKHNGIIMQKCNCGYLLNTVTGEESRVDLNEQNGIVFCPKCGGKNRVPANKGMIKVTCGHCAGTFVHNSSVPVSDSQKNTPPKVKSTPQVQLKPAPQVQPKPAPQVQPKPAPQVQPKPAPQVQLKPAPQVQPKSVPQVQPEPIPQAQPKPQGNPCRTITIERLSHKYKEWDYHGLKNAFLDKYPVRIVLDDVEQGTLPANEVMRLQVDSNEHTIRYNLRTPKYVIPPGNDSYIVYFFNDSFRIGPEEDDFRDGLTAFVLNIFRGRGIKDRILDSNNSGNKVYLDINPDGIRIYWRLKQTKGLKQLLTGESSEKISYDQMGLTPLAKEKQPAGYWDFIDMWVQDAIVNDEKADLMREGGGYTFRTTHSLF